VQAAPRHLGTGGIDLPRRVVLIPYGAQIFGQILRERFFVASLTSTPSRCVSPVL
jgi:hypothetical protein